MHCNVCINWLVHLLWDCGACVHISGMFLLVPRVDGWLGLSMCTRFAMSNAVGDLRKGSWRLLGGSASGLRLFIWLCILILIPWPPSLQLSIKPIDIGVSVVRGVRMLCVLYTNAWLVLFIHRATVIGVGQQCMGWREWWPGRCIGWYGIWDCVIGVLWLGIMNRIWQLVHAASAYPTAWALDAEIIPISKKGESCFTPFIMASVISFCLVVLGLPSFGRAIFVMECEPL